jgi:hypothetical protein
MSQHPSRRFFLQTAATAGAALGLGEWAGLAPLSPATADDAKVTPDLVRFGPDLEPVVRLIEDTRRPKCPAMMIGLLKNGLPYRNFLAALYLTNLRAGEAGHPLAVLHSAHQLTLNAPFQERLLPTFWALDSFKVHQERGLETPSLKPLVGKLPSADQAEKDFHAAMTSFDVEQAERAVVVLARTQGAARVVEPLWHYGARDWTFIGHVAIWPANTWRLLQVVGWQHAETTLRVLVRTMLGDGSKGQKGQPYAANAERVRDALAALPADWADGGGNPGLTKDLLDLVRGLKAEEAVKLVLAQIRGGKVNAGAVWDAVHLAAAETMLWAQGGDALHANTVSNALHFGFQSSGDPANRLLILLQAVSWMVMFRKLVAGRPRDSVLDAKQTILDLAPSNIPDRPEAAADEVLAARSERPAEAVRKGFAFGRRHPGSDALRRAGGRLLPLKASWDPHNLKFPVAMFEKHEWVSPEWRPHLLAATILSFPGPDSDDNPVVYQVREALRKL